MTYREYNMMEETYLMDEVKRHLCYVSPDFAADQAVSRQRGTILPFLSLTFRCLLTAIP